MLVMFGGSTIWRVNHQTTLVTVTFDSVYVYACICMCVYVMCVCTRARIQHNKAGGYIHIISYTQIHVLCYTNIFPILHLLVTKC